MIRCVIYCLLLACLWCLPAPVSAQVAPLPPRVVQLIPGYVVRERLVGLDSATYQTLRALPGAADAALADVRRELALSEQQAAAARAEVERCRQQGAAREAEYQQLAGIAQKAAGKPPARPLLLDWHTYAGAVAGAVVLAGWWLTR